MIAKVREDLEPLAVILRLRGLKEAPTLAVGALTRGLRRHSMITGTAGSDVGSIGAAGVFGMHDRSCIFCVNCAGLVVRCVVSPAAGDYREPDPLAEREGSTMEDWAHPASRGMSPPRPRPLYRRYPRNNASPSRYPSRGAQRQTH